MRQDDRDPRSDEAYEEGFEDASCPICGSTAHTLRYELTDVLYGTPGVFHLVTCNSCGHLYQSPRPTQAIISRYYPDRYQPFGKAIEDAFACSFMRWLKHRQLRTRCLQVYRLRTSGALLDVGCATGLFLNEMRQYGSWALAGIEPDVRAATYAIERFGLDVFNGQIEAAPWPDESFDVITLWDVLEHLPAPGHALCQLRRLLKKQGVIIVSVPNLDGADATRFGRFWAGLDVPRHFSMFRKQDLLRLFEETGYRVIRTYCFYGGFVTFANSLTIWLRVTVRRDASRKAAEAIIRFPLWRYLFKPYFVWLDRQERGNILTVVGQRKL